MLKLLFLVAVLQTSAAVIAYIILSNNQLQWHKMVIHFYRKNLLQLKQNMSSKDNFPLIAAAITCRNELQSFLL